MIKSPTTRDFFLIFCNDLKLCPSCVLSLYESKSLLGALPEYHRRAAYVQLLHSLPPSTPAGGKSTAGKREDPCIATSLRTSLSASVFLRGAPAALGQDEVRGKPKPAAAVCWGATVGGHWVTPFPPALAKSCGLTPRRQGLHPTRFQALPFASQGWMCS